MVISIDELKLGKHLLEVHVVPCVNWECIGHEIVLNRGIILHDISTFSTNVQVVDFLSFEFWCALSYFKYMTPAIRE